MKVSDVSDGNHVACISEAGNSLVIVSRVMDKFINAGKGLYHRATGLPANENAKGRLSADTSDIKPLLQKLEIDSGKQLISIEPSKLDAAVAETLARLEESEV